MMTKINTWLTNFYRKFFEIAAGKYWGINVTVLLFMVVGFVILAFIFGWGWTGFFAYSTGPQDHPGKTLWDMLNLAIIPLALVLIAYFFNKRQKESELEIAEKEREQDLKIAEKERELDREIAQDRQREAALQTYLDQMKELLLERGLLKSSPEDEIRAIAQTLTVMTMRRLDGKRNETLLRFLIDAGIIKENESIPIISFREADLSKIDLSQTSLPTIDFSKANLDEANLSETILTKVNLSNTRLYRANLNKAILSHANLMGADLVEANLSETRLNGTNLVGACLVHANLTGAGLRKANLGQAKLTRANLRKTDLSGADLRKSHLDRVDLHMATYDAATKWPDGFDPQKAGAVYVGE